jgi:hypothetical protein
MPMPTDADVNLMLNRGKSIQEPVAYIHKSMRSRIRALTNSLETEWIDYYTELNLIENTREWHSNQAAS